MAKPVPPQRQAKQLIALRLDPRYEKMIKTVKTLTMSNNITDAAKIIEELKTALPYDARPFMLEGDIFWRRQDTLAAMHAFRRAIDLNLDYLDKHTDLFQGKKIRKVVEEAKSILEKGSSQNRQERILLHAK